METHRHLDQVNGDDLQIVHQTLSLAQYSQTHPYQYLKQLNNVFQTCNKSAGKDYSIASKIKLPWKKFKTVSIPKCFEESYNMEKKITCVLKNSDDNEKSEQVEKERKFWKQHEELLKKYRHSTIESHSLKKQKMQQRKRNLMSAKSTNSFKNRNEWSMTKSNVKNLENSMKLNESKENYEQRYHDLKSESDQTQSSAICQSKSFVSSNPRDKNSFSNNLLRDSTNSQSFLKKKALKAKCSHEQMTIEEQVLIKLKKISMMPHLNRAKTANILSRQGKCARQREKLQGSYKKTNEGQSLRESRVKENEYLEYNMKEELIERYKNKIRQIDCSISEKNVKKTAAILREMQDLASVNVEEF